MIKTLQKRGTCSELLECLVCCVPLSKSVCTATAMDWVSVFDAPSNCDSQVNIRFNEPSVFAEPNTA